MYPIKKMFHLPEEILRKIYEYDSFKKDHWSHIISDINISFLLSIENEIFSIMTSPTSIFNSEWNLIKPKLEICFGQNLDEFDQEIYKLISKT